MDVTTAASLSQSMDRAVKHYSSLFVIPSYKKVLLLLALTSIGGGSLPSIILLPFPEGVVNGLLLGCSLFLVNLTIDYAVSMIILRRDPIYGLRRTTALSFFSWVLWVFFIFLGAIVAMSFGFTWWIRLSLLGFSAVITLRSIVLLSTSSTDYKRLFAASLLQPFSCTILFLAFWSWTKVEYQIAPIMFFIILSPVVGFISSLLFISVLNRVGMQTLGAPSLPLFKAFLLNWIVGLNGPFEEFLEKLGENQDVEISLVKFDSSKPKAVMIVPAVHPGPFKNVGSSLLPSMLKTALETKLDCVACVPHGLLGHEFDLASQTQNQKIINQVVESANLKVSVAEATPFIKVSNGLATACCQAFGNFAFLSFTLAPKTTEDLPQELGLFVRQEAERHGLTCCVIVNAHNSIDGTTNMQEALDALKTVAVTCLEKAVSLRQLPFEIGAATVIPKEFGVKEGMGPGGITVIVAGVGKQKTAYVVIDGNNLVSGLRENILLELHSIGIDEGEVFTTDTHSVNAIILNDRGYHPVGEAINHENLIGYIKKATSIALSELEHVKAACCSTMIPEVKVIGEKRLDTLCLLIDRALQKAKKIVVPIFAASGLFLMLILMFV
jgi:putative membrane protein